MDEARSRCSLGEGQAAVAAGEREDDAASTLGVAEGDSATEGDEVTLKDRLGEVLGGVDLVA